MTASQISQYGKYIPTLVQTFSAPPSNRGNESDPIRGAQLCMHRLLAVDPDDRLASLLSPNGDFSAEEMRQAEEVIGKFLNRLAHQEIIDLAGKFLDEGRDPQGISRAWLTDQRVHTLRKMLDDTEVRDKFTIACYVLIETHDRANAGYRLQQNRHLPRPDFANYSPTPEEQASDDIFASTI